MNKNQILFTEKSSLSDFKTVLKKDSPKNIFLVTGEKSYSSSGSEKIINELLVKYSFHRFSEFNKNPKIEDVHKGISLFKKNKCDYVIAIGGGSVMDMAKLINVGQAQNKNIEEIIIKNKKLNSCGKKLIVIPTTSGSGSEATHFAVVYINSKKYSLAHTDYLLPDVVFLWPFLTYSLSSYQTAVSGIDAFSQSIESYWSISSNEESKKYATQAIEIILNNLGDAVIKNSLISKNKMIYASYLAGKAINVSKTTGAHAISYYLTSKFNIPHGQAVALTLPLWFEYNTNASEESLNDIRGIKYLKKTMLKLGELVKYKKCKYPKECLKLFIEDIGLETKLSRLNVSEMHIQDIVENTNLERIKNNPFSITKNQLLEFLKNIL
jgi:alcohol dehydrogenase